MIKESIVWTEKITHIIKTLILSIRADKFKDIESVINKFEIREGISIYLNKAVMSVNTLKIGKESKEDVKRLNLDLEKGIVYDSMVIVHKIDLRTFLLGKNGFYNLITNHMYKKCSKF